MGHLVKPNRAPGVIWPLRRAAFVRTAENERIEVDLGTHVVSLGRADARLLARRLNQCLDSTAKR